jgi:hypothetical protein
LEFDTVCAKIEKGTVKAATNIHPTHLFLFISEVKSLKKASKFSAHACFLINHSFFQQACNRFIALQGMGGLGMGAVVSR